MPVYRFRLEDSKSGEHRSGGVSAPDKDEAEGTLERRELMKVVYQLSPEEVASLDSKLKAGNLSAAERSRLLTHRQEQPYKLKKLEAS
jgi:hypothetical protein